MLALPWSEGSWVTAVVDRQISMVHFQAGLGDAIHPYASPAWSWPLVKRPTAFYFTVVGGRYQEILALGSPLVWWAGLIALVHVGIDWVRGRPDAGTGVILMGGFAAWAPWLALSPGRPYMFLFYFLPTVPFLCLALAWVSVRLWRGRVGRVMVALFASGSVALFVFFYPILTGMAISPPAWKTRILFTDCRIEQTVLSESVPRGAPPEGWCWM
jgi:dolichyl-phosphate-mannose--protein O-mannosyl transferase